MNSSTDQPEFIAHYRVARHLGSGGMGEVFLAEDTKLDRSVALKLLPKEVSADACRRKRFLAEAKAASSLNHSSVCTIYEIGETPEGQPFIAMEYLEGQTLDALSRRRRLELREIVGIGVQVAEALEAARQHQVVHRDIKPGNLMADAQGRGEGARLWFTKSFSLRNSLSRAHENRFNCAFFRIHRTSRAFSSALPTAPPGTNWMSARGLVATVASYGPDLALMKDLLALKENQPVLEFLDECTSFWRFEERPAKFKQAILSGQDLDFGGGFHTAFKRLK